MSNELPYFFISRRSQKVDFFISWQSQKVDFYIFRRSQQVDFFISKRSRKVGFFISKRSREVDFFIYRRSRKVDFLISRKSRESNISTTCCNHVPPGCHITKLGIQHLTNLILVSTEIPASLCGSLPSEKLGHVALFCQPHFQPQANKTIMSP